MRFVIEGGLGNQIFQYAYYLNISKVRFTKTPWYLDISWFGANIGVNRSFRLFEVLPKPEGIELISISSFADKIRYLAFRVARQIDRKLNYPIIQNLFRYADTSLWSRIENLSAEIETLQYQFKEKYRDYEICRVAVHLRFGDYIDNPRYAVVDYNKMLELAVANSQGGKIKVFSDDPELASQFVSKQPQSTRFTIVSKRDEISTFIDLAHHSTIYCSNSTYSYAAALLGPATSVIIPQFWTQGNKFPIPHLQNKSIHTF